MVRFTIFLEITLITKVFVRISLAEYVLHTYDKEFSVTLKQIDNEADDDYRDELLEVVDSMETNIFLCSSIDDLPEILSQSQQVGLLTERHHFIISSLDMHTLDLEPYQYGETIITGLRIINPTNQFVANVTEFFESQISKQKMRLAFNDSSILDGLLSEKLQLQNALIYDAGEPTNIFSCQ